MAKNKRSNGEGSYRQLPNGHWQLQVMDGYHPNGKRKIKTFTAATKREVKEMKLAYDRMKAEGIVTTRNYSFLEWSNEWFDVHKNKVSPVTQESYKYTLRILQNHFGSRKMTDIKALDIDLFLYELIESGKSSSGVAQCKGMLFQIFNNAVANDIIPKNPAAYVEKLKRTKPKEKEAFSREEIHLMMENLPRNRIGNSIRLLLGTGMRGQELLALQKQHIAEDGSYIQITQAVILPKGAVLIDDPKTPDSCRTIPVPECLREAAIQLRNTGAMYIWEEGKPNMPCNPSYFRKQFKKALQDVGSVRLLTPHCCRHTYVSQMQALGVDLETIASLVGHTDTKMTAHYLHVQESIRVDAVQRLDHAFSEGD